MPTRATPKAGAETAATAVVMDFTNVKDRGAFNPRHKPEGDYKLKIVKVAASTSSNNNPMWVFTLTIPGDSQASYPYRCVLDENNAWKVRNLFMAAGINVPKKRLRVDPNKLINKTIGATLVDDEYEGKMRSVVESVFPESELPAASTRTATARKATSRKAAEPDDDEDEEIEEEEDLDEDEMEVDEL